ncbi:MAG: RHS repeat-associated core domain-containing protein [Candidatus Electrothrix sp. AW5]|nr:RHS repeat-associated core domain-containing protein [Candidatus Electrothrix gigas]
MRSIMLMGMFMISTMYVRVCMRMMVFMNVFLWSSGMIGQEQAFAAETYFLHDHLGSTALSLDAQGRVTEQMVNYPFGQQRLMSRADVGVIPADYTFTGKETDAESGLQYFEARYYDGVLGKFLSVDPLYAGLDGLKEERFQYLLLDPQQNNFYFYSKSNPIKYIDPDGKLFQWAYNLYVNKVREAPKMFGIGKTANPNKKRWELPSVGFLNFGAQGLGRYRFLHETSPAMQFTARYIPFMNAIAGFHDYMQIKLTGRSEKARYILSVPYMFVATPIAILAEFGKFEKALFSPIKKLFGKNIKPTRKPQHIKSGDSGTPSKGLKINNQSVFM